MKGSRFSPHITRRDFLNGVKVAAGGLAVTGLSPMRAFASTSINADPRAMRGGNLPAVFNVAHWLRDRRLSWASSSVTLAPGAFDPAAGTFSILEDNGAYDVIVVGSGISGLSSAFYLLRESPNLRILVLEANGFVGGNASADEDPAMPGPASTSGAYGVFPYAEFLTDLYGAVGIDWEAYQIPDPGYAYFFDEHTPHVNAGARGWTLDVYEKGLKDMPYSKEIIQDLQKAKQDFQNWYNRSGSPTDPADDSDPRYDYLAGMSLEDYLLGEMGFHEAVADFYTLYAIDALAGQSHQVSAYTAISFLGAEYYPAFAFPGGNAGITRHLLKWLSPGAIDGSGTAATLANAIRTENLDLSSNNVRIRLDAVALRAEDTGSGAAVVYYKGGAFYRARASSVILAGQTHTNKHLVSHLAGAEQQAAFGEIKQVPVVTANVTLRDASAVVSLAPAYDLYWWGSRFWADAVIADWGGADRLNPSRPVTLTFYGGNWGDPGDMPAERAAMISRPFGEYEDSMREDLNRVLAAAGFDFDRDVTDIAVYRWGHGMVYPYPGFPHGAPVGSGGQAVRTPSPRHAARQQLGYISFAGQDTESSPALESAFASGLRTAQEVLGSL